MFFALAAATAAWAGSACYANAPGPLNIAQPIVGETNQLHLEYAASAPWSMQTSGDRLALVAQGSAGQLEYAGETFTPQYAEIHAPAEHTLGLHRQAFPAELQIFHTAPSGKTLALSVLFKQGQASPLFDGVLSGQSAGRVDVGLPALLQEAGGYFAYATPRCSDGARQLGQADQWVLLSTMSQVSPQQMAKLAQALPTLAQSSRPSVDAQGITVSSSLVPPKAAAPAAPPAKAAAPPAMPASLPPAAQTAFVQGGQQLQQLDAILQAYPPEQRAQIQSQYEQWYNTYERYLQQVQGNQAVEQQALAYQQQVADYHHAQDRAKEANVITGGYPMAFLEAGSATGSQLARREAAVAAREQAVAQKEQQVASELASLAALEGKSSLRGAPAEAPAEPAPAEPVKAEPAPAKAAPAKAAPAKKAEPAKASKQKGSSFAQVGSQVATQRRAGAIGGGASDLHFLAAANLPADTGDHEDAATVAAAGGDGPDDEDAGQHATVEDSASTAANDAAGENADNDNLESILLQKGAKTKRVHAHQ